jgi:ribosomal protein S18 acetylase RimI-like enzyme
MARYEDEIKLTIDDEKKYLENVIDDPSQCMIGAYIDGEHAGSASIAPVMRLDKYRHRAGFGMSVKKKYWHLGVGTALLSACIETARDAGYEQLELEVVADNTRAIALYERLGFVTYGRRPHGFKFRDGSYIDELLMVLML